MSHEHQHERVREGPPAVPEITIESLNINKSYNLRGQPGDETSWRRYEAYFQDALKRLEASGGYLEKPAELVFRGTLINEFG